MPLIYFYHIIRTTKNTHDRCKRLTYYYLGNYYNQIKIIFSKSNKNIVMSINIQNIIITINTLDYTYIYILYIYL